MTYIFENTSDRKCSQTFTNKQRLLSALKAHPEPLQGLIYGLPTSQFNDPSCLYGWDMPTFKTCARFVMGFKK